MQPCDHIQTYTGLVSAAAGLLLGPIAFLYARAYGFPGVQLNPLFFLVLGVTFGVLFLCTAFWQCTTARRLQIILLWASGFVVAIESAPGNVTSFLFLAAGLGLSVEQDLPGFRRVSVAGVVGVVYLAATAVSLSKELPGSALRLAVPGHVFFGSTIGLLLFLFFNSRFESFRRREEALNGLVSERTNELQQALEERGKLIREIHHRVKNNMQLTSSLLQLTMHHTPSPNIREELGRLRGRIEIMGLVHHGIYRAGELSHVALAPFLSGVLQTIEVPGYSRPDVQVELPEQFCIDLDLAVPLGLVTHDICAETGRRAREAVHRGVSPQRPAMQVRLDDGCLCVTFEELTHEALLPDLDPGKASSLELQIISGLCEQMAAEMSVEAVATSQPPATIVRHSLRVNTLNHV